MKVSEGSVVGGDTGGQDKGEVLSKGGCDVDVGRGRWEWLGGGMRVDEEGVMKEEVGEVDLIAYGTGFPRYCLID